MEKEKKVYSNPDLVEHGDLVEMTLGGRTLGGADTFPTGTFSQGNPV